MLSYLLRKFAHHGDNALLFVICSIAETVDEEEKEA